MQYTVLSNLSYNGQAFVRGSKIELDAVEAEQLLVDQIISDEAVPVVEQADWKRGPEDIKYSDKEELNSDTGEVVVPDSEDEEENEPAQTGAAPLDQNEDMIDANIQL
jgi:hypothetical protein